MSGRPDFFNFSTFLFCSEIARNGPPGPWGALGPYFRYFWAPGGPWGPPLGGGPGGALGPPYFPYLGLLRCGEHLRCNLHWSLGVLDCCPTPQEAHEPWLIDDLEIVLNGLDAQATTTPPRKRPRDGEPSSSTFQRPLSATSLSHFSVTAVATTWACTTAHLSTWQTRKRCSSHPRSRSSTSSAPCAPD